MADELRKRFLICTKKTVMRPHCMPVVYDFETTKITDIFAAICLWICYQQTVMRPHCMPVVCGLDTTKITDIFVVICVWIEPQQAIEVS